MKRLIPMLFLAGTVSVHAGLIQWFKLEEGAADPSTNMVYSSVSTATGTNNGYYGSKTITNGLQWVTSAIQLPPVPSGTTAALQLSGSNAIVTTATGVLGTNARSIAVYVRVVGTPTQNATIVGWGPNSGGQRFDLRIIAGSGGWVPRVEASSAGGSFSGTNNIADGNWHHVALTYDGTTSTTNAAIYVDGVLDTASQLTPSATPATSSTNILIGDSYAGNSSGSRKFTGMLDDVRIYDHALTLSEITNLVGQAPTPATALPMADRTMVFGATNALTFTANGAGTPPLSYQWYYNGSLLLDKTNRTLVLTPVDPSNVGTYSVTVSNVYGGTNISAQLSCIVPSVTPPVQMALAGTPASFTVNGLTTYQPYTYQWTHAGTNLPGTADSTLILPACSAADVGIYSVVVSLGANSITSSPATLSSVIPLPTKSFGDTVAADAPAAWWRLDEPAESQLIADVTQNNHLGVSYSQASDVTLGVEGALLGDPNTCADFTGYNQTAGRAGWSKIRVENASDLNGTAFTVECWAMVAGGSGNDRSPVTYRNSGTGIAAGFYLDANTNNQWQFSVGNGTVFTNLMGPALVENQWAHLVGTCDGTTAAFYVNGAPVATCAVSPGYVANGAYPLFIGAGRTETMTGNDFFPGRIDEVAVYSKALSAAQVQAHFAAGAYPAGTAPRFTLQPRSRTTLAGGDYTLSASIWSAPPVNCQWMLNGTNLPGATNASLVLKSVTSEQAGSYSLVATHGSTRATNAPVALQVIPGQAVSLSFEGGLGTPYIANANGYAGAIQVPKWNEKDGGASSGNSTNCIDNRGLVTTIGFSWTNSARRNWKGPRGSQDGDLGMLAGFLEAFADTNVVVTISGIPTHYQSGGYSLYVYMGAPSANAGIVNSYDTFGQVTVGSRAYYYHGMDLALWDGGFYPATTTDPSATPSDANCVVFRDLSSDSLTLTVAPHPNQSGPATLSGIQIVANAAPAPTLSTNASLANLAITPLAGSLVPAFSANSTNYTGTSAYADTPVVKATSADTNATLQLSFNSGAFAPLDSGVASGPLSLAALGTLNTVDVKVTAQDGVTVRDYIVKLTRQPSLTSPAFSYSLNANNLVLSWPSDHLGYRLLQQTNNLDKGISSNPADWMEVSGTAALTTKSVPVNQTSTSGFFRLVYP